MQINRIEADKRIGTGREVSFRCKKVLPVVPDWHVHDFPEFLLVDQGRIWHMHTGRRVPLGEGALVFTPPGYVHYFRQIHNVPCTCIFLGFRQATLEAACRYLGDESPARRYTDCGHPLTFTLSPTARLQLSARFLAIGRQLHQDERRARMVFRGVLADLLSRFFVERPPTKSPVLPDWLAAVCEEMRKKENLVVGLPALRRLAHKSPAYVCQAFRKHLGITPSRFVTERRLDYAADLLATTDDKISTVAWDAGFSDLSYFHRSFKGRFGVTPAQFHNRVREQMPPEV